MLALIATIAGSVITAYSAYKIYTTRSVQSRKLRDMEILRRLNVPPKKQVRVWSFLMALGLILLTPGLGLLLSSDPISGYAEGTSYPNLRATPSKSPVIVPPMETMESSPRTVRDAGSGASRALSFFAPSGGGGKGSSSGAAVTTSRPTSAGSDPTGDTSISDDAGGASKTKLASSGPKTDGASEKEANSEASEYEGNRRETAPAAPDITTYSAKIDAAPEKTSSKEGKEPPLIASKTEKEGFEVPSRTVPEEPEDERPAYAPHRQVAETSPELIPEETAAGTVAIGPENLPATEDGTDREPMEVSVAEKGPGPILDGPAAIRPKKGAEIETGDEATDDLLTETVTDPEDEQKTKTGTDLETPVISAAEKGPDPTPGDTSAGEEIVEEGPVKSTTPEDSGSWDIGKVPASGEHSPDMEVAATTGIFDAASTGNTTPQIEGVKRLEFKAAPPSTTEETGNLSEDNTTVSGPEDETNQTKATLSNLNLPFGDGERGPRLDTFGKGFNFETGLERFGSGREVAIDENGTLMPAPIMEFEKMDFGSNVGGGFGLTPSSPFG
ncbi:hypothetical protein P0O24_03120 [Methanotrichaceae archaeon M04Ac]|uniref:Uncharacterized protein n=1 Tax=Candidatus Methanocrinis alkalitolerans TaxID=3033395 RepID=A0ABT5XDE8_9EURY|nr:hypothetical protein [Candidatus Methanocrinis alkalitolerans]MDF0592572.1 hypothetical protein [Candidatus Methanocrinis alkalitolerans]